MEGVKAPSGEEDVGALAPPLGFKVSIARENFGQFHIIWAFLDQSFGQFHIIWVSLRQNFGQFHIHKTVSIAVEFLFFCGGHLNLNRKTDRFFGQNSMNQVIFREKVWSPPNPFELLRP